MNNRRLACLNGKGRSTTGDNPAMSKSKLAVFSILFTSPMGRTLARGGLSGDGCLGSFLRSSTVESDCGESERTEGSSNFLARSLEAVTPSISSKSSTGGFNSTVLLQQK